MAHRCWLWLRGHDAARCSTKGAGALRPVPSELLPRAIRGEIFVRPGVWVRAERPCSRCRVLETCIQRDPTCLHAYHVLGMRHESMGQLSEAQTACGNVFGNAMLPAAQSLALLAAMQLLGESAVGDAETCRRLAARCSVRLRSAACSRRCRQPHSLHLDHTCACHVQAGRGGTCIPPPPPSTLRQPCDDNCLGSRQHARIHGENTLPHAVACADAQRQ